MAENESKGCMDVITKRPRTQNTRYTELTEIQRQNIKVTASPHFHVSKQERAIPLDSIAPEKRKRNYVDRFVNSTNEHLLRGVSLSKPYCWIDYQWSRYPAEKYNSCREGAHIRWGPNKTGERTRSHNFGETVDRYTTIDMYRRNPTNQPGLITMDYGRPGDGYYFQKYPSRTTWSGSSVPLNRTRTLTLESIRPKTKSEYEQNFADEQALRRTRTNDWPEYSEYTDKFLIRTKTEPTISTLESMKRYAAVADVSV